ncbi:MAG: ATP-binding protein [Synergistaceae bacterium]|jgi:hypothetical protein|nr:ATP-binding protein [Synergistaceae bacterium]
MDEEFQINPFTPTFGSIPMLLAGRKQMVNAVLNGLRNGPGDPNRATIFIGARGSGKTVLLTKIAEEAAKIGWISANVTASETMLDEIIDEISLNGAEFLEAEPTIHLTGINIAGFGADVEAAPKRERTWRTQTALLIKALNEKNIGLLLTVDEVDAELPGIKTVVTAFQHFVRERRDVALLMAGLPHNVSELLSDKRISFLRRAFQHGLDPIEQADVRESINDTITLSGKKIEAKALGKAAMNTGGFPFLIQLIGYHSWEQAGLAKTITSAHVSKGIDAAFDDMGKMIFRTTIKGLSDTDIRFLKAMSVDDSESAMADIKDRMNVSEGYASQYRLRLIEQGLIAPVSRGKVEFAIPMTREYIKTL